MRSYVAEGIGTFALVLVGTGAIVVNDLTGGGITHLDVSLAFGLVVMTMIAAVGGVSGAHLNPAVTLGFWAARRLPGARVAPYVASQAAGALAASMLVALWFPGHADLGTTRPSGTALQSLTIEMALTFLLVFVILGVATGAKERGTAAGVAVGGTVALCALFGGPVSGASMNPARSLGPAMVSGQLDGLWLYAVGPALGALLAVVGCRCVRPTGCCGPAIDAS
jgi:aquaporin Z